MASGVAQRTGVHGPRTGGPVEPARGDTITGFHAAGDHAPNDTMTGWMRRSARLALAGLLAGALPALAQERFSLYVPSPQSVAEAMAKMAGVTRNDVVVDLGSGDGRIVTTAARLHGARGWGVDINPELVELANSLAKRAGVADRVQFFHQNLFDADLREVTVVNLYLFPELMRLLRPKLLAELRPGARILSHDFDFGSWEPDERISFFAPDKFGGAGADARILLWIVPARVAGFWSWTLEFGGRAIHYESMFEQRFQNAEGFVRVGARRGLFNELRLRGESIAFSLNMTLDPGGLVRHEFRGTVRGDTIEGTVRVTPEQGKTLELPWRARRTDSSAIFRPTGIAGVPAK
jgi:SAM-dependent methyltransferase